MGRSDRQAGFPGRALESVGALAWCRGEDRGGVLADEVTHTETAQLGPVLVGWEIWKRLAMPAVLKELGLNRSQRQAAAISVINRLVDPVSEHALLP